MSDRSLVTDLQREFDAVLERTVGRRARVALVDYPYSQNSGDAMIWRGERSALARLDADVVYTCETEGYDRSVLASRLGDDGVVLLHGGGNFGDYWPQHQRFREQVLRDFPGHRVIQLPQSIGLREPGSAAAITEALAWHTDFVVLCRDQPSLEIARTQLALTAEPSPDAAFGTGPLTRPSVATHNVLVLARTDHERAHRLGEIDLPGAVTTDWTLSGLERRRWKLTKLGPKLARSVRSKPGLDRWVAPIRDAAFESLAKQSTHAAHRQLSRHRVVVTDRLHAHVMCVMLDIPHVVLDNAYGKIRGLHDAWTVGSTTTTFADSVEEAAVVATALAHRG